MCFGSCKRSLYGNFTYFSCNLKYTLLVNKILRIHTHLAALKAASISFHYKTKMPKRSATGRDVAEEKHWEIIKDIPVEELEGFLEYVDDDTRNLETCQDFQTRFLSLNMMQLTAIAGELPPEMKESTEIGREQLFTIIANKSHNNTLLQNKISEHVGANKREYLWRYLIYANMDLSGLALK